MGADLCRSKFVQQICEINSIPDKEIKFDTHSVELNYDVAKIAQLTDDTGNIYTPVSWTGGKGGHHVEGILAFPTIANSAKKVTLTIPHIDNKDRIFNWDLK